MASAFIGVLKRANAPGVPETSLALRSAVLGAVLTATVAVAAQGAISASTAAIVVVALAGASWVSHRRREKTNFAIKIGITLGAIVALARMLSQLSGLATLDEIRFPLAELFLWVQVLHSFDLPARKDLNFSLGSSLTLMAVAGSLSQDLGFGVFLIVYAGFAVTALLLSHGSELAEGTQGRLRPEGGSRGTTFGRRGVSVARGIVPAALAAVVLWLVIPQPTASSAFAFPFSLGGGGSIPAGGGIANPGFSGAPGSRSSASSYHGFNETLDLRVRGDLSDEVVMRVRASAPALWKGLIFDRYDGATWSGATAEPRPLEGELPYGYPSEFRSLGEQAEVTQTFYVEREQAGVIFAAGQPDSLFFEGGVSIDALGGLRTDQSLAEGSVYSVVSSRGAAPPEELRRANLGGAGAAAPVDLQRYLELPSDLPRRVSRLARRVTADETNDYDRVKAVERYLADNYRYSLDSPVPEPGRDAVDHFLFDTDVGFCEQFASATTVMLRSLGVPTRLVAGYTTGTKNPFTGYYEIKGSDAHTWVEAWFPGHGWYEFDPTFAVPPAEAGAAELFPIVAIASSMAEWLEDIAPGAPVLAGMRWALAAAALAVAPAGLWILWGRRAPRRRRVKEGIGRRPQAAGPVTASFARLEGALAAAGAPRAPAETGAEMLDRTTDLRLGSAGRALEVFEQERYGDQPPNPGDTAEAVLELDRLTGEKLDRNRAAAP